MKFISLILSLLIATNSFAAGPVIWGGTQATNLQTGGMITQGTMSLQNASGSQPILRMFEDPDNGTNSMSMQSAAAIGSDFTLTWPADDGTTSQALTTDGSGVLSWSTVAANNDSTSDRWNMSLAPSVGSSNLTVTLKD